MSWQINILTPSQELLRGGALWRSVSELISNSEVAADVHCLLNIVQFPSGTGSLYW